MRHLKLLLPVVLFSLFISPVSNASLKDKEARGKGEKNLQKGLDSLNKYCGGKIEAKIDWDSFTAHYKGSYQEPNAGSFCKTGMEGIESLCRKGETEKAAVNKGIHKVLCHFKAGMTTAEFPKTGIKLAGGAMDMSFDWDTANMSDGVKEFLNGHLE
jgi:hypothetical protein